MGGAFVEAKWDCGVYTFEECEIEGICGGGKQLASDKVTASKTAPNKISLIESRSRHRMDPFLRHQRHIKVI